MSAYYSLIRDDGSTQVATQRQNGTLAISDDGNTLLLTASAAGGAVGKSALTTRFAPVEDSRPQPIDVRFGLLVAEGTEADSLMIADFESSCPEIGTNPGIRVYLRDGFLRVDRSKIGISEPLHAEQTIAIEPGDWNDIHIRMIPGVEGAGLFQIFLNDELILSDTGDNVLSDGMREMLGLPPGDSFVDRVQVGLTSNTSAEPATVAISDLEISVNDEVVVDGVEDAVQVAESVYVAGTENDPAIVEIDPGTGYFGVDVTGDSADEKMAGTRWDDHLSGGAGHDTIHGGAGNDVLTGGAEADVFVFEENMGTDTITDFVPGVDRIAFSLDSFGASIGLACRSLGMLDLSVNDTAEGVLVHTGHDSFLLLGVTRHDLTVDDFILC